MQINSDLESFLKPFFPIYFFTFFLICLLLRTVLIWKKTGINPIRLRKGGGLHDFIGKTLVGMLLIASLVVLIYSFYPHLYPYTLPAVFLEHPALKYLGLFLLIESLIWVALAQAKMGSSWRIGVDQANQTTLVIGGFFRYSRNPIYLGMIESAVGFFLVLPNALTLLTLVGGFLLMQIQIRLEEEHLTKIHGEPYLDYFKKVRRWL